MHVAFARDQLMAQVKGCDLIANTETWLQSDWSSTLNIQGDWTFRKVRPKS